MHFEWVSCFFLIDLGLSSDSQTSTSKEADRSPGVCKSLDTHACSCTLLSRQRARRGRLFVVNHDMQQQFAWGFAKL